MDDWKHFSNRKLPLDTRRHFYELPVSSFISLKPTRLYHVIYDPKKKSVCLYTERQTDNDSVQKDSVVRTVYHHHHYRCHPYKLLSFNIALNIPFCTNISNVNPYEYINHTFQYFLFSFIHALCAQQQKGNRLQ